MSPADIKIIAYTGAAVVAWWLTRNRTPTGNVELGIPTVTGSPVLPGTDIYYSDRVTGPAGAPLGYNSNPAVNDRMRELIDESNASISYDDSLQGVR